MLDLLHLNRFLDHHFYQNHQYGLLIFTIKHKFSSGPFLFVACCDSHRNLSNSDTCPIRNVVEQYLNGKFHCRWISVECLAWKHYFTERLFSAALINVLYPWVLKQAEGDIDVELLQVGDSQEFHYIESTVLVLVSWKKVPKTFSVGSCVATFHFAWGRIYKIASVWFSPIVIYFYLESLVQPLFGYVNECQRTFFN